MLRRAIAPIGLAILAAAALTAESAVAQTQEFRVAPLGTRVWLSERTFYEIDSVEGYVLRTVNSANLRPQPWYGLCFDPTATVTFDRAAPDRLWPLAAGKEIPFETARNHQKWNAKLRVVGPEQITVPAGTFATWVIEQESVAVSHEYHAIYRCHYAPDPGVVVKRTRQIVKGDGGNFTPWQATRIELRDRSKTLEFAAPRVGMKFTTTTNHSFEITGVDGKSIQVAQSYYGGGRDKILYGGLNSFDPNDALARRYRDKMENLWPLSVGKSFSYDDSRPNGGVWNISYKVDRTELIDTEVGRYFTYVIVKRDRGVTSGGFDGTWTWWWSPALNFFIKSSFKQDAGAPFRWTDFSLRRVDLPPAPPK